MKAVASSPLLMALPMLVYLCTPALTATGNFWRQLVAVAVALVVACVYIRNLMSTADDQNLASLVKVLFRYRNVDFVTFMRDHRKHIETGNKTKDYCPGVCHYYELMSDVITVSSGPFWHFVPMHQGYTRMENHHKFHDSMVEHLACQKGGKVLELGCGFGEIGRQVAKRTPADVTGLTMSEVEVTGATERIHRMGLEDRCRVVQGDYHELPFEDGSFDQVFGVYTLKYSAKLETVIAEAARVLKPGGRFVSYEILVSDRYKHSDERHRAIAENISRSTCMPPLHHAKAFRSAAEKAGLVLRSEVDIGKGPGIDPWYSCFEKTGVIHVIDHPLFKKLISVAESWRILPKSFADFWDFCIVHPTCDFVYGGREGIIDGSVMMVWEKAA